MCHQNPIMSQPVTPLRQCRSHDGSLFVSAPSSLTGLWDLTLRLYIYHQVNKRILYPGGIQVHMYSCCIDQICVLYSPKDMNWLSPVAMQLCKRATHRHIVACMHKLLQCGSYLVTFSMYIYTVLLQFHILQWVGTQFPNFSPVKRGVLSLKIMLF